MGYLITPTSAGIYIPNVLNETNACSNSIFSASLYSQVGNIITVSIFGSTIVDFSTFNYGEITFDFPIIPLTYNAIGTIGIDKPISIQGVVYLNYISLTCNDITIIGQSIQLTATFQYRIN